MMRNPFASEKRREREILKQFFATAAKMTEITSAMEPSHEVAGFGSPPQTNNPFQKKGFMADCWLPFEIVEEIISRAPIESVIRCKPTSKQFPAEFNCVPCTRLLSVIHCDGLLLCKWITGLRNVNVAVWNPVLGQVKFVDTSSHSALNIYGFGYDDKDSYKILRISVRHNEFEIYDDFKSKLWRAFSATMDCTIDDSVAFSAFRGDRLSLFHQLFGDETREIEVWVTNKVTDGVVTLSKYFNVARPDLPILNPHFMRVPTFFIHKTNSIMLWCDKVVGEGYACTSLYEIGRGEIKKQVETGQPFSGEDERNHFVISFVYVPSLVPVPE
ncbi:unnamed protein product [Arabidopsis lyrata]|nr:unnamed protein product [Arabidopsis lyrata]